TILVAGGSAIEQDEINSDVVRWLRKIAGRVRRIGSVCTGAMLLARAGLLDGRRATTHWNWCHVLIKRAPRADVDPNPIFIRDENVYTSAGVTAGMDLALALVEEDYGSRLALQVARNLVLYLRRPGGQSQFSAALSLQLTDRKPLRELEAWVLDNLNKPLNVPGPNGIMNHSRRWKITLRAAVLLLIAYACHAQVGAHIAGIWASEEVIPSAIHGVLIIDGQKLEWRATISKMSTPVQRNKDAVAFVLPNGAGEFRGRVVNSNTIRGHWIQSPDDINNNRYATPVELRQIGDKIWRGEIAPLVSTLSYYMSIQQSAEGSLTAVIRNPERNRFGRNVYRIDVHGDALSFSEVKNPSQGFTGNFDRITGRLSVSLPDSQPRQFGRIKNEHARGFYPRFAQDETYHYLK